MITNRPPAFGSTHIIQNVRTRAQFERHIIPTIHSAAEEFGEFVLDSLPQPNSWKWDNAEKKMVFVPGSPELIGDDERTVRDIGPRLTWADNRVEFTVNDGDETTFEYDGVWDGENPFTQNFLPNLSETLGIPLSNTGLPDSGAGFSINA